MLIQLIPKISVSSTLIPNNNDNVLLTTLSFDRTYLAAIRTNAIFVAMSYLLYEKRINRGLSIFILFTSFIINIWTTINYVNLFIKENKKNRIELILSSSIMLAFVLSIVQLLYLYYFIFMMYSDH